MKLLLNILQMVSEEREKFFSDLNSDFWKIHSKLTKNWPILVYTMRMAYMHFILWARRKFPFFYVITWYKYWIADIYGNDGGNDDDDGGGDVRRCVKPNWHIANENFYEQFVCELNC